MENEKRYQRTNNLFYVVCSRTKENLAVVCTADLIDEVLKRGHRAPTKIVSDKDPKKLVQKLIKEIGKAKRSK